MTRLFHVFATLAAGGPQVRTARLVEGLGAGFEHVFLSMDADTSARALLPPASAVETEVLEPLPPGRTWARVERLRALLAARGPDLVLTYNWGAIEGAWAALSQGRPLIHHEDGFVSDEVAGFKRRRVWARRLSLRRARALVVPSRVLERIALETWRLPRALVRRIPNGIPPERFARPRDGLLRAELGIPAGAFVVGSVGHLRREKNPVRLVRAVARLGPGAHLLLVGDGPERGAVERAGAEAGLGARLHLVGHREDIAPWYAAMDAFAIPSDTEQLPVALLEAMASGLPVAATDVGDVGAVVPEQGRDLVRALEEDEGATEAALAEALASLARDPGRRAALGAAGRTRVAERYGFERMLAAYRELYGEALGVSGGA